MDLEEFGSRGLKGDRCHLALLPRSLNERNGEEEKERDKEKERERGNNKMQPTNPNAHTYVNGTDVKTHGYAITQNTFLQ